MLDSGRFEHLTRCWGLCFEIAAASILAKVTRDRWGAMTSFPGDKLVSRNGDVSKVGSPLPKLASGNATKTEMGEVWWLFLGPLFGSKADDEDGQAVSALWLCSAQRSHGESCKSVHGDWEGFPTMWNSHRNSIKGPVAQQAFEKDIWVFVRSSSLTEAFGKRGCFAAGYGTAAHQAGVVGAAQRTERKSHKI